MKRTVPAGDMLDLLQALHKRRMSLVIESSINDVAHVYVSKRVWVSEVRTEDRTVQRAMHLGALSARSDTRVVEKAIADMIQELDSSL